MTIRLSQVHRGPLPDAAPAVLAEKTDLVQEPDGQEPDEAIEHRTKRVVQRALRDAARRPRRAGLVS